MVPSSGSPTTDPRRFLADHAGWLFREELGAAIVGSAALAEACRREALPPPRVGDLDLAWALDPAEGERLLTEHRVFVPTTEHNRARGTLAAKLGGTRIEITSYRGKGASGSLDQRLRTDLAARDMTVGAVAWRLCDDAIVDPLGGVRDWRERRIVACGVARERVAEHPVRLVRYYRRAHEWGFELDASVRRLEPDAEQLRSIPREALAQELRALLLRCASPGRALQELHDAEGALAMLVPELAPQFGPLPAGPVLHHPEVTQALHLTLALEWATAHGAPLAEDDRLACLVAVLCHDLGKNLTPADRWPSHHGHEGAGTALVARLLDSLPGLSTSASRRLAESVCALHLVVRKFHELRSGTLVGLYERWFRQKDFRIDLFALAVGADVGGRLDRAAEGERVATELLADLCWLRERCESVDASGLKARWRDDLAGFRQALLEARSQAVAQGRRG